MITNYNLVLCSPAERFIDYNNHTKMYLSPSYSVLLFCSTSLKRKSICFFIYSHPTFLLFIKSLSFSPSLAWSCWLLSESCHAASISHGFLQCRENFKKANAHSSQKSLREFKDITARLQEVFGGQVSEHLEKTKART